MLVETRYGEADAEACRRLHSDAAQAKGKEFAAWALQARRSFVAGALSGELEGGSPPDGAHIRQAVQDYVQVLRQVYAGLVLDPHMLQDTALQDHGAPGLLASACTCGAWLHPAVSLHSRRPCAGEDLHHFRLCQRRFIVYRSSSPCTPAGGRPARLRPPTGVRALHVGACAQATPGTLPCKPCGSGSRTTSAACSPR